MSAVVPVRVRGVGAVSPAGWGVPALRTALAEGRVLPEAELPWPGSAARGLRARRVPPPAVRPAWLGHPRLRRSSPITHHAVGAALEALGLAALPAAGEGVGCLGVVACVMTGCAAYSRRFYDEVLRDPATASPLVFPETVFNAPASHLASVLGAPGLNYTLVGDPSVMGVGLALAAQWLEDGQADRVLVVGAEEVDWTTAEALGLLARGAVLAEGAGALCLERGGAEGGVGLAAVTQPRVFLDRAGQERALAAIRRELAPGPGDLLVEAARAVPSLDRAEARVWADWTGPRQAPQRVLGEGLMAGAAWQCVAAVDALASGGSAGAIVSLPGSHHAAVAARFVRGGG